MTPVSFVCANLALQPGAECALNPAHKVGFLHVRGGAMATGKRVDTRRMKRLRDDFFEEGKRLDADPETRHLADCWLCKQRIDYTVAPGTTSDSHNLDHYHPVSTHPEIQEDPTGWRHSHAQCNRSRGNGAPSPGLGEPVPAWW